ncbi:MAG TPA: DNA polymerase IV [Bacillota bacterium]|jgi:DNA polymerase-4
MNEGAGRSIIHVDMDAFFAAVEQLDNPALRGLPVIVGGSPQARGVVSTASYEARRFGVRSAMPTRQALALCPQAILVRPRIDRYVAFSRQIRRVFHNYTDLVEPLSLDEAFLDVTRAGRLSGRTATAIAAEIKTRIARETGLTASVGVAPNKLLAKLASDLKKPDGFVVLDEAAAERLLPELPVRQLWGIGLRTEEELHRIGVFTVGDLRRVDPALMVRIFGRRAEEVALLARGIDERPVEPRQETKSVGVETTFAHDVRDRERLLAVLGDFAAEVADRLREGHFLARTVTVKVRLADFTNLTRSQTLHEPTDEAGVFAEAAAGLAERAIPGTSPVRLIGLAASNLLRPGDFYQVGLPF